MGPKAKDISKPSLTVFLQQASFHLSSQRNLMREKSVGIRVDSRAGVFFLSSQITKKQRNRLPFLKKETVKQGGRPPPAGLLALKVISLSWMVKDLRNSWRFVIVISASKSFS